MLDLLPSSSRMRYSAGRLSAVAMQSRTTALACECAVKDPVREGVCRCTCALRPQERAHRCCQMCLCTCAESGREQPCMAAYLCLTGKRACGDKEGILCWLATARDPRSVLSIGAPSCATEVAGAPSRATCRESPAPPPATLCQHAAVEHAMACLCMCMCKRARTHKRAHKHVYIQVRTGTYTLGQCNHTLLGSPTQSSSLTGTHLGPQA